MDISCTEKGASFRGDKGSQQQVRLKLVDMVEIAEAHELGKPHWAISEASFFLFLFLVGVLFWTGQEKRCQQVYTMVPHNSTSLLAYQGTYAVIPMYQWRGRSVNYYICSCRFFIGRVLLNRKHAHNLHLAVMTTWTCQAVGLDYYLCQCPVISREKEKPEVLSAIAGEFRT